MWEAVQPFLGVLLGVVAFLWLLLRRAEPLDLKREAATVPVSWKQCSRCAAHVPEWFIEHFEEVGSSGLICRYCTEAWRYPTMSETESQYADAYQAGRVLRLKDEP